MSEQTALTNAAEIGLQETPTAASISDVLCVGFGTTVAMWFAGYLCRMPSLQGTVPPWVLLILMCGCLLYGGYVIGRWTPRSWKGGLWVGLLSAVLNLLILGSLLSAQEANRVVPSALLWIPGSLLAHAVLGMLGATFAQMHLAKYGDYPAVDWTNHFCFIAAAATLLLLVAGGLVTSYEAGLAVTDWPNSFGYNMFLYPLSRMTGGIFYEHAHRLLGSLVGLTTLVLAVHLTMVERRAWVKYFVWGAFALVVMQGIMGGLRVTGSFTLSTSETDMTPNITLAIIHGVTGQVFFGMLIALTAFTAPRYKNPQASSIEPTASTDHNLTIVLVLVLMLQLILGAVLRHVQGALHLHVTMAAGVTMVGLATGVRMWGLYTRYPLLVRLGTALLIIIGCQLVLGVFALVVTTLGGQDANRTMTEIPVWEVLITTAHQGTGAILLAVSVSLACWCRRLIRSDELQNAPTSSD